MPATNIVVHIYYNFLFNIKLLEKDLGFLRIGSLNVRVKKTTEAFSNFLGVGSTQTRIPSSTPYNNRSSAPPSAASHFDKMHKTWGSADNIPQVRINKQYFLYYRIIANYY